MHSLLNLSLDRLIIWRACRGIPSPDRHLPHAEEATALLESSDFFCDFVESPTDFRFVGGDRFQFKSQISTPWEENNLVRGDLFRCAENWQDYPTVILLHGWNDELGYRFRFPHMAKLLVRHRVNCLVVELPYHLHRRPRARGAITDFISEDLWRMVEASRQAIADTRALVKWLQIQGCEKVGLWGVSLGAWLGGLVVCCEPMVNFAVLTTPVAKLERVITELAFCAPIRRSYEKSKISLVRLNLVSHQPKTARKRILIQEAEDDLFAPKEAIEEFWSAWNEPEIWRMPYGHISILMSLATIRRTVKWIALTSGTP